MLVRISNYYTRGARLKNYRLEDASPPPNLLPSTFSSLATRNGDPPIDIPPVVPTRTPKSSQPRYAESSVYPYLETNIDSVPMSFSQEPIPTKRSELSVSRHGEDTPFRHHSVVQEYIAGLVNRKWYGDLVSYNTTVELAEKIDEEWRLVLRKDGDQDDEWWEERFDAVIVASGHYNVPYIPKIEGLEEFERERPGSVKHSKMYRGRDNYYAKVIIDLPIEHSSPSGDADEETESHRCWCFRVRSRHCV